MQDTTKRETIKITIGIIVFFLVVPILFLTLPKKGDVIVYNCSISEISPDFPLEVREQCRKLRAENILQKPK